MERIYELVDRREPLGALCQLWTDVAGGHGQIVVLEGEAGVGKSRLAYELRHGDAAEASWLTVQCSPLASEKPFGPLATQLPGIDSSEEVSPEERHAAGIASAVGWAMGLSEAGPAVLHVEDIHWADPSTKEVIERISDALASEPRPLLVLCTARPRISQGWLDRPGVRRIDLSPSAITTCRSWSAPPLRTRCPRRRSPKLSNTPMVSRSTQSSWWRPWSTRPRSRCRQRCKGSSRLGSIDSARNFS